jgi:hypothetical protein
MLPILKKMNGTLFLHQIKPAKLEWLQHFCDM